MLLESTDHFRERLRLIQNIFLTSNLKQGPDDKLSRLDLVLEIDLNQFIPKTKTPRLSKLSINKVNSQALRLTIQSRNL